MRDSIVAGMATILWASAWADHVGEQQCQRIGGCEITDVMPPVPQVAKDHAERIAKLIEAENDCTLGHLYVSAMLADGLAIDDYRYVERFGECLAWMSMGAGVSWFDDHEKFAIKVPHDAGEVTCDLMALAEGECDECAEVKPKRALRIVDTLTELVREQGYRDTKKVGGATDSNHIEKDRKLAKWVRELLSENHFVIW